MTKQQERIITEKFKEQLKEANFQGLKAGAKGILGAVLDMCNQNKTVDDIRKFCEKSLGMDGMK